MRFSSIICISLMFLVSSSAFGQKLDDAYFKNLADDACDCTGDLLQKVKLIEELAEKGDFDQVMKLSEEIDADSKEMERCMIALEKKYPEIDDNPENERRAEAALAKHCPLFAEAFAEEEEEIGTEPYNPDEEMTDAEIEEFLEGLEVEVEPTPEEDHSKVLTDKYYNDLADEICGCTEGIPTVLRAYIQLEEQGDEDGINQLYPEIDRKRQSFDACMDRLEKKHGHLEEGNPNYETRALETLDKRCPDFMFVMENIYLAPTFSDMDETIVEAPEMDVVDDPEIEAFAEATCKCIDGMSEKLEQFKAYEDKGDEKGMKKIEIELEALEVKMEKCFEKVEKKFAHIEGDDAKGQAALAKLTTDCPEFMYLLEVAASGPEFNGEGADIMEEPYDDVVVKPNPATYPQSYYNDFADEVCNCIDNTKGLKSTYKKLKKKGNQKKLNDFKKNLVQKYPGFEKCLEKLDAQIDEIDHSEKAQERVIETIMTRCPIFIELIGE